MRKILVTGTAGFIGFHLAKELLAEGWRVHGFDGMTDYYDVRIKQRRHAMLAEHNRSVQAQRSAYEPRKFSMGEIRAWEKRTGRFYYQMTPTERAQANVDIEAFVASGGGSEAPQTD